jgi:hypothetical protein
LGERCCGEKHPFAKLTEADVRDIWRMRSRGMSMREITEHVPVTWMGVRDVLNRKNWKWLTLDPDVLCGAAA